MVKTSSNLSNFALIQFQIRSVLLKPHFDEVNLPLLIDFQSTNQNASRPKQLLIFLIIVLHSFFLTSFIASLLFGSFSGWLASFDAELNLLTIERNISSQLLSMGHSYSSIAPRIITNIMSVAPLW